MEFNKLDSHTQKTTDFTIGNQDPYEKDGFLQIDGDNINPNIFFKEKFVGKLTPLKISTKEIEKLDNVIFFIVYNNQV